MFDWIAFDADDTLWHNERIYRRGRERFREILSRYQPQGDIDEQFNTIEIQNLRYYGYGVMSFVLSQIEAAIQITKGQIRTEDIQALIALSKEMLTTEVILFDHVRPLLSKLSGKAPLMMITKGDLAHQRRKVKESGLRPYFQAIEVVSEKSVEVYDEILRQYKIDASHFLMVGNSIRSDIQPVLDLGGWAIHVSPHLSWDYEGGDIRPELKGKFREVDGLGEVYPAIVDLQDDFA